MIQDVVIDKENNLEDFLNVKKLFLKTLDDLCLSVHEQDHYEITRASGLLRQLLIDGDNLVSIINRDCRLKIRFEMVPFVKISLPDLDAHYQVPTESIDPSCDGGRETVSLNREQFLNSTIGDLMGTPCSVKDIIKYVANSAGGVHYGTSTDQVHKQLREIQNIQIFQGYDFILQVIRAIGRICLKALRPLRDKVIGMERFSNTAGIDVVFSVMLLHNESDELFILDIGSRPDKNRVSLYIDQFDRLTVQVVYSDGRVTKILAGRSGCIYTYGNPCIIELRVARYQDYLLVDVGSSVWSFIDIGYNPDVIDVNYLDDYVIGSDFFGSVSTHMRLFDICISSELLTTDQKSYVLNQYRQKFITDQSISHKYYHGNQFEYSFGHPYHSV